MTPLEILIETRNLLSDRSKWCQCYAAKDKAGNLVAPTDPEAIAWCALGAIRKCGAINSDLIIHLANEFNPLNLAIILLQEAGKSLYDMGIMSTNDIKGYEATMEMFDEAIERGKLKWLE
jgi:hypothetical protein